MDGKSCVNVLTVAAVYDRRFKSGSRQWFVVEERLKPAVIDRRYSESKENNTMKKYTIAPIVLFFLLATAGWSQTVNYKEYRLKNGLRVILSEDHNAPTYSIAITYNAGSRDEKPGRTGFAHLFEHMMFQGSENVG